MTYASWEMGQDEKTRDIPRAGSKNRLKILPQAEPLRHVSHAFFGLGTIIITKLSDSL